VNIVSENLASLALRKPESLANPFYFRRGQQMRINMSAECFHGFHV
jgi:hypothetical protein